MTWVGRLPYDVVERLDLFEVRPGAGAVVARRLLAVHVNLVRHVAVQRRLESHSGTVTHTFQTSSRRHARTF